MSTDSDGDIKTFVELYEFLQQLDNSTIKPWLRNNWMGKDKQESLLRLFMSLNLIDKLHNFTFCKGNFNLGSVTKLDNIRDFFYDSKNKQKCLKDSGDSSDLTAMDNNDCNTLLITTSKNYKKYNITKLDIEKIMFYFTDYSHRFNFKLCIVVTNSNYIDTMLIKSKDTSKKVKNLINNAIIIDWNDLNQSYIKFKSHYKNIHIDSLLNSNKSSINFKFHQQLSILKTLKLKSNNVKQILWGHIQRSGKSYIMCGTIIEDSKCKTTSNYLIITTAPNETIQQYIQVLNCIQLIEHNIIYLHGGNNKPELKDKNIIICSKQYLQNKSIKWLQNIIFDIRFIDESHYGGTTVLAQKMLNKYSCDSFTVFISATYSKPVDNFNINKEHMILWNLEDINLCKRLTNSNIEKLINKHGNDIKTLLDTVDNNSIEKEYQSYLVIN